MWPLRGTLGPLEPLPFQGSTCIGDWRKNMVDKKETSVKRKPSNIIGITNVEKGWNAVFLDEEDNGVWFEPIACFALCKRGVANFVGSMVSQDTKGLIIAEERDNFLGIAPPGETPEAWEEALLNADDDEENQVDKDDDDDDDEVVIEVTPRRKRKIIRS